VSKVKELRGCVILRAAGTAGHKQALELMDAALAEARREAEKERDEWKQEAELKQAALASAERDLDDANAAREQAERERDEARSLASQRWQDRHDALGVKTREGLTASEWLLRTGKAERERDEAVAARERAEADNAAMRDVLLVVERGGTDCRTDQSCCPSCGARGPTHDEACRLWHALHSASMPGAALLERKRQEWIERLRTAWPELAGVKESPILDGLIAALEEL
jgi:hypothetical protein